MWSPYTEHAASGLPNHTHFEVEVRFCQPLARQVTTRIPRIVTECLLTRSMLIKIFVHDIYSRFYEGAILSIRKHAYDLGRVKRIWYLSPMRTAKVQARLRIRAVSPEPPLLAHTSRESRGTFRQKARSLAPLNGWACAVKICHDGMLEDTVAWRGSFNHYSNYRVWWLLSVLAVLLWTRTVHFCYPRPTRYLRFETSFRPDDQADWEGYPPSYGEVSIRKNMLRMFYPLEQP